MLPFQSLIVLLLLFLVTSAFILQDLPLERFERSGHSDELLSSHFERRTRSNLIYRQAPHFMSRFRMLSE